jgi:hypothetical protein
MHSWPWKTQTLILLWSDIISCIRFRLNTSANPRQRQLQQERQSGLPSKWCLILSFDFIHFSLSTLVNISRIKYSSQSIVVSYLRCQPSPQCRTLLFFNSILVNTRSFTRFASVVCPSARMFSGWSRYRPRARASGCINIQLGIFGNRSWSILLQHTWTSGVSWMLMNSLP